MKSILDFIALIVLGAAIWYGIYMIAWAQETQRGNAVVASSCEEYNLEPEFCDYGDSDGQL